MLNNVTSHGFENVQVELLSITPNPRTIIWTWYRETWAALHGKPYDQNDPVCQKAVEDVLGGRALPTPLEQLAFQFRVSGLSRVALAQITRGRVGWAYNVLSQMPAPIEHKVTVPRNIAEHPELGPRFRKLAEDSAKLYDDALELGVPPQDARYGTLHGQQTSLVLGSNYSALKGFFIMRAESGLTDELNLVARLFRRAIVEYSLSEQGSEWQGLGQKLDCLGANQKACLINDKVFGATGRFGPGHVSVSVPASEAERFPNNPVSDYDFTKSAWYLELQNLPESLLLPEELEMIERWKSGGTLLP